MALARKIAYNIVASSASKVLSTILSLVSIGFITRYLGKEGFGNYATVLAFLAFFSALSDLGLYHIATREISRERADENKILSNVFTLRIVASLIVVILSPLIIFLFDYPPEVERGIFFIALAFLFSSSYQVLNGIFQKNLAMDKVAFGELMGKFIQTGIIISAVKYNLGFDWIIASLLFYMICTFIIIFLWSRKYIRIHLQFDFLYWKKFLRESIPMGISTIITFAYFRMDTILLSVLKDSSDVGIYNAAYKVLENITFFPAMVAGLVFPLLSYNIFTHRQSFEEIADKTFKFFTVSIIPLIIGTLFFSENIIGLIGGAEFMEAVPVLQILIFALALIFFGNLFNTILIAANLQKKMMYILGFAAVVNIVLNFLFIPKYSYFASAYISVLTEFMVVASTTILIAKYINYIPSFSKWNRIFLAGAIMTIIFYASKSIPFFISALIGTASYFTLLWILDVINTKEIISLISKKGVEKYEEIS